VRAIVDVKVVSIDKKIILERVYTDPSIVLKVIESLIKKLIKANEQLNNEILSEDEFNKVREQFKKCENLPLSLFMIKPNKKESYIVLEKILKEKDATEYITMKKDGILFFTPFKEDLSIKIKGEIKKVDIN
jgi:CRP-like cAMP-binding protein